ncbi:undecaprenyldiphospho-muramoylpentapeptide beta-N-acetylglucosaminyltransferase [Fulvimarina sp. 2208YS6-2-32]|uniref:UDP-N-acetylglucosamine--N-acetylmuramyl-(pentapeptide) pyrophosphoryl-undecaprenol N-acetylglucosamine transferase n=1 Tax=Fulvimarina uroteuthidis TaxID=3098149 RepID=A0ABU5I5U3_9HYPH|nr:undecaprenyldiphospho-muramoylpentapeptide beta-N-acetylglucosaminyltransferase [Fulvimarina sp. 2208YS6-2-32]MDY8110760.1 undecaprenyldiphospho-muramoylpentapeptide beta-N-acetylglucosaminyltransferase [Fulvimarina sp. 2208YS6-2-32]
MSTILLSAGGTGGHLFPAEALAHELVARGHRVHLATDDRAGRFTQTFPGDGVHTIASATFASRNPVRIARTLWTLWQGFRQAGNLVRKIRPDVVVGFGGYPTVPPLMAASRAGRPTIVHEQNAVMGRANRFLAGRVDRIAAGIAQDQADPSLAAKMVVTGNPVRAAVLEAAKTAYAPPLADGPFRLVVFGGSQGARFFSQIMPETVRRLPEALARRLHVTQQARKDDAAEVERFYRDAGIEAEVAPFFGDMARRIGAAHLVVSRSGASTVSEIAVIGRPAVLVPYPYALDHDQAANAARLEAENGALVVRQADLSAERLAAIVTDLAGDPDRATAMAAAARRTGMPDAAIRLADLVESLAATRGAPTASADRPA